MKRHPALLLAAAATLATSASAATIAITTGDGAGADTYLRADSAGVMTNNYGATTSILLGSNVGSTTNGDFNLLMRYDLSALITAAAGGSITINSASLQFVTAATGAGGAFSTALYSYGFNFVEGSANGTAQAGSSTYNDPVGTGADTLPGGTAGTLLASLNITSASAGTTWTYASTSALTTAIQNAIGAGSINFLAKETSASTDQTFIRINSGEIGTTALRPTLNIDYTVTAIPEPSTYGLLGAGALAAATLVRRRRKAA